MDLHSGGQGKDGRSTAYRDKAKHTLQTLVKNLESLPRGISDRLMEMRITLHGKMHLSLINVYAPTMTYTLEEKELFNENLSKLERLPAEGDYENAGANFRDVVYDSASQTLGYMTRKHQDWFDNNNKEITTLLLEKKEAFPAWLNDKDSQAKDDSLKNIRGKVQTELRQMKDKWWENKAAKLQQYADEHNSKKFFAVLKDVYGATPNAMAPVRSANGTLLTKKSNIIQRHSRYATAHWAETLKVIKELHAGKAPGPDGIPSEIFKERGVAIATKLTEQIQQFWEERSVPQDFKDADIVHLYKNKGDRASCENHRGISLLSIAGKIMARVVLNRITHHLLDDVVSESQCGFRSNRGTKDMIFALRQLQEKCREQNQNLYFLFVDLAKAFDTVSR
ncbi:uncharacterized protein [Diadema antillarum]|uniref:uncharacterized protein n=1 Tax=Diadema antillarum TaxID=105358 RepID=UPI003A897436